MRVIRTPRREAPAAGRQRTGVILLEVLALLTIFAIGTISFVFYADTQTPGARPFREAALVLVHQTVDLAEDLIPNLHRSIDSDVDFRHDLQSIDDLDTAVRCLLGKVREARAEETDPRAREDLDDLIEDLERYLVGVDYLRDTVEQLQRRD